MRILVLGAGMLGYYLHKLSVEQADHEIHFASRTSKDWDHFHVVDIQDKESISRVVQRIYPDIIINTAVYGGIKRCEEHPLDAEEVNHWAHYHVIDICNDLGIPVIYVSTNSVFCGQSGNYHEDDDANPTTVYGQTKRRGELATINRADDWSIFRITALFGEFPEQQDFVQKLISELGRGNTFHCWDQVICPSHGPFVADVIYRLIMKRVRGIWHITGNHQLSRYEIGETVRKSMVGGRIEQEPTPHGLPIMRTLNIDKLSGAIPELEFPDFHETVQQLITTISGVTIH